MSPRTRKHRKLRKHNLLLFRHQLINSLTQFLSALEVSQQKTPRAELIKDIQKLVEYTLTSALQNPRGVGKTLWHEAFNAPKIENLSQFALGKHKQEFQQKICSTQADRQPSPNENPLIKPLEVISQDVLSVHLKELKSFLSSSAPSQNGLPPIDFTACHPEIVLYAPQIPPNAGTVARLCAAFSMKLHFIEPLGFSVDAKQFRRAGLDYWKHVEFYVSPDWHFFRRHRPNRRFVIVETGGKNTPAEFAFQPGDILLFGSETMGIPHEIIHELLNSGEGHLVTIPMWQGAVRSINLANTVAIVAYTALEQLHRHFFCMKE